MSRDGRAVSGGRRASSQLRGLREYYLLSRQPWHSLLFILPMLLAHELGQYRGLGGEAERLAVVAYNLICRFFELIGLWRSWFAAITVIVPLIAWHLVRRDSWRVEPAVPVGMLAECGLLSLPLLAIGALLRLHLPLAARTSGADPFVIHLGAGIYEELVFRMLLFGILHLILIDLLEMRRNAAWAVMIPLGAALFSAYHYLGLDPVSPGDAVFFAVAGAYFGCVYLARGYGITVGTHALYDVLVWAMAR